MATHPRSLSSLMVMANHLRLPTHLIPETALFLSPSYTVHLSLSVLKLPFIVYLLLLFLICFLSFLPVAFSGRLAISKRHLIYFYFSFCLLSLWLSYQVNGGLNDRHLYLVLGVVSPLTCIVWWSSSDSLVVSNIGSQIVSEHDTAQTEDLFGWQEDILTEIFKKLLAFHDFAFCSTVCKRWRSRWLNLKWSLYPSHPWSIHFQDQNILNHLDDGRYVLERWEIHGRYYYGCVNGWILSIGSKHISIFNLFSRTQTNLPILSRVRRLRITKPSDLYRYIVKFILFKACNGDNLQFRVVALFGRGGFIAFKGPQFRHWIYSQRRDDIASFIDVVRFRGRFHALCDRGNLFLCDFHTSNAPVSLVATQLAGSSGDGRYYLVNNNGDDLIAVFQKGEVGFGGKRFDTETFRIYRFDITANWTRISEPDYLKGRALFISSGNSWTIDPAEVESCRTNSIYFADDYWFSNNRDGHLIGVFDIVNGTIEDFQFEMDQHPPNEVSPFSLTDNVGA